MSRLYSEIFGQDLSKNIKMLPVRAWPNCHQSILKFDTYISSGANDMTNWGQSFVKWYTSHFHTNLPPKTRNNLSQRSFFFLCPSSVKYISCSYIQDNTSSESNHPATMAGCNQPAYSNWCQVIYFLKNHSDIYSNSIVEDFSILEFLLRTDPKANVQWLLSS